MATKNKPHATTRRIPQDRPARSHAQSASLTVTEKLRAGYGLNRAILARMLGIAETTLARWESNGQPMAPQNAAKIKRLAGILKGLSRVMRTEYIPTWLENRNDGCVELGAKTPIDLMERGDYEAIEGMIFFFGSGVPS